ncbi:peptidylprolyl isomerase [Flavobacteriaceae bacterium]|jgi:cyclophilin family peptidyl-prolyl cis-trans isomerase|nr:peptidylprolyl isomerase [Flavobacteriaceae bacterium]MDC0872338.1 peptidylprolyl isomerase [Flavobacteriaceae bacterium]
MEGIYAKLKTSKGSILIELTYQQTPGTVGNFVSLAEGTQENNHKKEGEPYYDGIKFHRVIADFMIQGGCPQGTGSGGPGYQFEDEFHPELKHNRAGTLSMANAGPGTNGSQFFITHGPTDWLDGKHTVFGYVVEGQEVVDQVAQGDLIESLTIERHGAAANEWSAQTAFQEFNSSGEARKKAAQEAAEQELQDLIEGMKKTESGLYYTITKEGAGATPPKGAQVSVHYKGTLLDGTVFDSSYQRNQPIDFSVGVGQVIPGWDEGIMLLNKGASARFVIPSHLAYGAQGAGGVIPPDATLIFEVELVNF